MLNDPAPGVISRTPLRKVNIPGSIIATGYVCSETVPQATIDRQGPNELPFLILAELDPRVSEIHAQPMLVEYRDDEGRWHKAYPDYHIRIDGRDEIHEIKPDAEYARPGVRRRLELVAEAVRGYGFPYSVALASVLHQTRKLDAVDEAWRRLKRPVTDALIYEIDDLLAGGPMPAGEVLAATARHSATLADIHALLARGKVRADMRQKADRNILLHGRNSATWFSRLTPWNDPLEDRA